MSYLFEYVYEKYKKDIIKSETIRSIRYLLIPYFLFFVLFAIACFCPPKMVIIPIAVCIIDFFIFLIIYFSYRHKGQPTEIAEELQRPEIFNNILKNFEYQEERFKSNSKNHIDLSKPVEIDCLLSDCDCYLANKIDSVELFAIVIPLINCFISGDSIPTWIQSLSEFSRVEIISFIILTASSVIFAIIMIYMVISTIKNMQTLCFPTKKAIVISMRRDLLRIKLNDQTNGKKKEKETTFNYSTAKE